jgi:hypothetical protein
MIIFLLIACNAFAEEEVDPFVYVGFASMRVVDVDNQEWKNNLKDLATEGFKMTYTSFKKVLEKFQHRALNPKTLELPDSGELLTPHNTNAVEQFHKNINVRFDHFLRDIAAANYCRLIIYNSVERNRVLKFISGQQEKMLITVMVYYLDSNSVGMKYIPIAKDSFTGTGFIRLKSVMHQSITGALEEAIANTSGMVSVPTVTRQTSNQNKRETPEQKEKSFQEQLSQGANMYQDAWD